MGKPKTDTIVKELTILNGLGLHARAAALFVKTANGFKATITVSKGTQTSDGKSILSLLMLAAVQGTRLVMEARGKDAAAASQALAELVDTGFGEE